jgi:outer membrane lipoprotein SlyB
MKTITDFVIIISFALLVAAALCGGCAYTDARISVSGGARAEINQTASAARPVGIDAAVGDAAIGALAGGAVGSAVPILGTGAGAAAGAAAGAIVGNTDTTPAPAP